MNGPSKRAGDELFHRIFCLESDNRNRANVKGFDIMDLKYCDKTTPFQSPAKSTGQKHARNFTVWP